MSAAARPKSKPASRRRDEGGSSKHAFAMLREGALVGYLGSGRGPIVTAAYSALPDPISDLARFTSVDIRYEAEIGGAIQSASSFEELQSKLTAAGFALSPVEYENVFIPLGRRARKAEWPEMAHPLDIRRG